VNVEMSNLFERPILIYSQYCTYSKEFIGELLETPDIFEAFIRINIDVDEKTRQRPKIFYTIQDALGYKITDVPTIIVGQGEFVLHGEEAFKWLHGITSTTGEQSQPQPQPQQSQPQQSQPQPQSSTTTINPFNPNEMGAFSDGYAQFGDCADASEQSFKFLDKHDEVIPTPQDRREKSNANRQENTPLNRPGSHKQNELDKRFEQLLAERDSMVPPPISRVG
jgi:hypothetical protein